MSDAYALDAADEVSSQLIIASIQPGTVDRNTGIEKREWREVAVEGAKHLYGQALCLGLQNVFSFGGASDTGDFSSDLFMLQHTKKNPFTDEYDHIAPRMQRQRSREARRLFPVVDEVEDTSMLSSRDGEQAERQEPARSSGSLVDLVMPGRIEKRVVPKLPLLCKKVGYENCYNSVGTSMEDLILRNAR